MEALVQEQRLLFGIVTDRATGRPVGVLSTLDLALARAAAA
jgi:hypothetical protein